jgi:hypothetical protein
MADDHGMLFVASKDGHEFQTSPRNVFAVRDLYSFESADGVVTEFETGLSQLEGTVFPLVKEIANSAILTSEREEAARLYLACSMLRNPAYQRMVIDSLHADLEATAILMERHGQLPPFPKTGSALDGKTLAQMLRDKDIGFEINNSKYLEAFQATIETQVRLLGGFGYSLLISDAGDVAIGDHPVTYLHPGVDFGFYGSPGGGEGCELTFPISKNVVLVGHWETPLPSLTSSAAVRQANLRQAMFADNFLASGAQLPEAAIWLNRYRGLAFTSDVARLPAVDGFYILSRRGLLPSKLRQEVSGDVVKMETFA